MLGVILTLTAVGILLWLVNTYIPMQDWIKRILNIVAIILVILWLLQVFGILAYIGSVSVPRLHR